MGLIYKSVIFFNVQDTLNVQITTAYLMITFVMEKWDCPKGEDEVHCELLSCPKLFKCKNETKCLSLAKVCDNNFDCINGEDEKSCGLRFQNVDTCPTKCTCISLSAVCSSLHNAWFSHKLEISCSFQMFQLCSNIK